MSKVNKKVAGNLEIFLPVVSALLLQGCVSENKIADNPVKWLPVDGDGIFRVCERIGEVTS